jgi:hypothetical protein
MSRQSDYVIAQSRAMQHRSALSVVAVELQLHGQEQSLGLERWSG